mmetsp:Transcript_45867/g.73384  ORF Transcript_45867/g.73384 Transcript_45867/m.73384 type:complete len:253 (-) Transcript_45867:182-940(-)
MPSSSSTASSLVRTSFSFCTRSVLTSLTRSRHTFVPTLAAASISASLFVLSLHVALAASCASKARSDASPTPCVAACDALYVRWSAYTVVQILCWRRAHMSDSEWSYSASADRRKTALPMALAALASRGATTRTRPSIPRASLPPRLFASLSDQSAARSALHITLVNKEPLHVSGTSPTNVRCSLTSARYGILRQTACGGAGHGEPMERSAPSGNASSTSPQRLWSPLVHPVASALTRAHSTARATSKATAP